MDNKNSSSHEAATSIEIEDIYQDAKPGLLRYISRLFRRPQEAEDVVQEAFVKVMERQRRSDIYLSKAYLYKTARNAALAEYRKKSFRLTDALDEVLTDSDLLYTASMEAEYEASENFELICRAVRALPVKCRRVYVLCRVYGFSQKEVAAHMGISLKGVEGHLARATQRCKDYLKTEKAKESRSFTAQGEGRINEQR